MAPTPDTGEGPAPDILQPRTRLPVAMVLAGLAGWLVGGIALGAPMVVGAARAEASMPGATMTAFRLISTIVLVAGMPAAAVAVVAFGLPAHLALARQGGKLQAYAMAGALTGVLSAMVVTLVSLLTQKLGSLGGGGGDAMHFFQILVIPGVLAGVTAALMVWRLRRPDLTHAP